MLLTRNRDSKFGGRIFDLTNSGLKCTQRFTPEVPVDRETGEPRPEGRIDGADHRYDGIIYMDLPDPTTAVRYNCTVAI